jgi:hypothetical protein
MLYFIFRYEKLKICLYLRWLELQQAVERRRLLRLVASSGLARLSRR